MSENETQSASDVVENAGGETASVKSQNDIPVGLSLENETMGSNSHGSFMGSHDRIFIHDEQFLRISVTTVLYFKSMSKGQEDLTFVNE